MEDRNNSATTVAQEAPETNEVVLEWVPRDLPSPYARLGRVSAFELAADIKAQLKETFNDIFGIRIYTDSNGSILVDLALEKTREKDPDKIDSLQNIVTGGDLKLASIVEKKMAQNNRAKGKMFQLSEVFKKAIEPLMVRQGNRPIQWDNITETRYIQAAQNQMYGYMAQNNASRAIVIIRGLDIRALCSKLYGTRMVINTETDSNGDVINRTTDALYSVKWAGLSPIPGNFFINIEQFSGKITAEITAKEVPQMRTAEVAGLEGFN